MARRGTAIREVRTRVLEARLKAPFAYSQAWYATHGAMLVEITTDDGVTGWGEAFGPARLTAPIVEYYAPLLIGRDAMATEAIWQDLYNRLRDHGQKGLPIEALSAVDILQPDICAAGGLSECRKIADMANAFGVRCNPHVWGTGVALAAALQLLAVIPHNPPGLFPEEPLLEFDRSEHPVRQAVLTAPFEHHAGRVAIPTEPGLGIEIDRAALDRFRA